MSEAVPSLGVPFFVHLYHLLNSGLNLLVSHLDYFILVWGIFYARN